MGGVLTLDADIYLYVVHELRTPFLNILMPLFSTLGDFPSIWFFLFLATAACGGSRGRAAAAAGIPVLLIAWLTGDLILKEVFARLRPFDVYPDVELLTRPPSGYSFPSAHASTSFAAVAVFWWCRPRRLFRIAALVLAALISCARVYVGVHYPLDVLGGAVWGLFTVGLAAGIVRRRELPRFY
ncbi:MAG: phosphatase PAP2 family protein [Candidatus Desulforudis sp.]|nr:phosphatase PAP2 family protein [Desulforudis sp.]